MRSITQKSVPSINLQCPVPAQSAPASTLTIATYDAAADHMRRLTILRSFVSGQLALHPRNQVLAELYRKVIDKLARLEEAG